MSLPAAILSALGSVLGIALLLFLLRRRAEPASLPQAGESGFTARLLATGLVPHASLRGCTASEVESIAREVGGSLPPSYRAFLLAMGRGSGDFLVGEDLYPRVREVGEWARELLRESGAPPLPPEALVIRMHQGYEFAYFVVSGNTEPEVYQYIEDWPAPKVAWPDFTAFLDESLANLVAARRAGAVLDRGN